LTAWAFRHVQDSNAARPGPAPVIALPTVVADGRRLRFSALDLTLALTDVVVMLHPGWPVEHPAEATGGAVRLRPRTGAPLPALPKGTSRPVRFATGPSSGSHGGRSVRRCHPFAPGRPRKMLVLNVLDGGQAPK
jgi:hypothetical protein